MFLDSAQTNIEIKIQWCFSMRYLKTLEPLNWLHSFMDQFLHYIHEKLCRYQVFNIFTQYVWKIMSKHCNMLGDRIGNWSAPHFIKQVIAESGLTPHSAIMWPLWTLLFGRSFPQLSNDLQSFSTNYRHSLHPLQHCIIIRQGYIVGQNEVCWDC